MKYRLLIAVDVLDFTAALTRREQEIVSPLESALPRMTQRLPVALSSGNFRR